MRELMHWQLKDGDAMDAKRIAEERFAAGDTIEVQNMDNLDLVATAKKRNDNRAAKHDQREASLAQERASFESKKVDAADAINGDQAVAQRLGEDAELDAEAMKSKARSILDQADAATAETRDTPMVWEAFMDAPTSPTSGKTVGDYYANFVSNHIEKSTKNQRIRQQLLRELNTTENEGFTPPISLGFGE